MCLTAYFADKTKKTLPCPLPIGNPDAAEHQLMHVHLMLLLQQSKDAQPWAWLKAMLSAKARRTDVLWVLSDSDHNPVGCTGWSFWPWQGKARCNWSLNCTSVPRPVTLASYSHSSWQGEPDSNAMGSECRCTCSYNTGWLSGACEAQNVYIGLQIHHRLTQRQLSTGQFPEYF